MILGFTQKFPWGKYTYFRGRIINGGKIHTIREDAKNRWKAGNKIHCAVGVRTKQYKCFKETICTGTQAIEMHYYETVDEFHIRIDGRKLSNVEIMRLAVNDGFSNPYDFYKWFIPLARSAENFTYKAKLIHWTDYRY